MHEQAFEGSQMLIKVAESYSLRFLVISALKIPEIFPSNFNMFFCVITKHPDKKNSLSHVCKTSFCLFFILKFTKNGWRLTALATFPNRSHSFMQIYSNENDLKMWSKTLKSETRKLKIASFFCFFRKWFNKYPDRIVARCRWPGLSLRRRLRASRKKETNKLITQKDMVNEKRI